MNMEFVKIRDLSSEIIPVRLSLAAPKLVTQLFIGVLFDWSFNLFNFNSPFGHKTVSCHWSSLH